MEENEVFSPLRLFKGLDGALQGLGEGLEEDDECFEGFLSQGLRHRGTIASEEGPV